MPLYVADYTIDTLDLTAEESGAYLILLMLAWRRGGSLPSDLGILKRMLGGCVADMHGNRFNRIVPKILERYFYVDEEGNLRNKRLEKELKKARILSGKQREKAEKRWSRPNKNNNLQNAAVMPPQQQSHTSTDILVDKAAREERREGKKGTPDCCGVTYSETERHGFAVQFPGLDVDQAIAELDRWCDRELINDPLDRRNAIYGGLRTRYGRAQLVGDMEAEHVDASPELSKSRMTRKPKRNGRAE